MISATEIRKEYDVVVIGGRPAGAGTARLLARQGRRVLMVDRGQYGADTLSTHALMRAGVLQLARWGVLPRVVAAGTPPVRSATFVYGDEETRVPVQPRDGIDALYAPRRTVLDALLADAAAESGVHVAYGTTLVDVLRSPDGRVIGAVLHQADGNRMDVRAGLVIGADGRRSTLARLVPADVTKPGPSAAANVFGYWSGIPVDGYRWYFRPGLSAGAIPTNDGLTCVFASVPSGQFGAVFRDDIDAGYRRVIAAVAPDLAAPMQTARLASPLKGAPGQPAFFRRSAGPGWALVGDAGYFKDPLTAHGITDALVDAEYLSRAIADGTDAALIAYAQDRDRRAARLFDITDRIASFKWSLDEARVLHKQLARAMADEVTALLTFTNEAIPA